MRYCFSVWKILELLLGVMLCMIDLRREISGNSQNPTHPFLSEYTWYVAPCHINEKKLYQYAAHSLHHECSCIWPGIAQHFVRET